METTNTVSTINAGIHGEPVKSGETPAPSNKAATSGQGVNVDVPSIVRQLVTDKRGNISFSKGNGVKARACREVKSLLGLDKDKPLSDEWEAKVIAAIHGAKITASATVDYYNIVRATTKKGLVKGGEVVKIQTIVGHDEVDDIEQIIWLENEIARLIVSLNKESDSTKAERIGDKIAHYRNTRKAKVVSLLESQGKLPGEFASLSQAQSKGVSLQDWLASLLPAKG